MTAKKALQFIPPHMRTISQQYLILLIYWVYEATCSLRAV